MGNILKEALKREGSDNPSAYYWLYDKNNPIELLLSRDGEW